MAPGDVWLFDIDEYGLLDEIVDIKATIAAELGVESNDFFILIRTAGSEWREMEDGHILHDSVQNNEPMLLHVFRHLPPVGHMATGAIWMFDLDEYNLLDEIVDIKMLLHIFRHLQGVGQVAPGGIWCFNLDQFDLLDEVVDVKDAIAAAIGVESNEFIFLIRGAGNEWIELQDGHILHDYVLNNQMVADLLVVPWVDAEGGKKEDHWKPRREGEGPKAIEQIRRGRRLDLPSGRKEPQREKTVPDKWARDSN